MGDSPTPTPSTDLQGAMTVTIPAVYRQPLEYPLRWQDERTGALPEAVRAFYAWATNRTPMQPQHLAWVIAYIRYYLGAPCWEGHGTDDDAMLAHLREQAEAARTVEDAQRLIQDCLGEMAIDPL